MLITPGGKLLHPLNSKLYMSVRCDTYPASTTNSESFCKTESTGKLLFKLIMAKNEVRTRAVSGVSSEGFMTIVHPTASAGATFHALRVAHRQVEWIMYMRNTHHIIIG